MELKHSIQYKHAVIFNSVCRVIIDKNCGTCCGYICGQIVTLSVFNVPVFCYLPFFLLQFAVMKNIFLII